MYVAVTQYILGIRPTLEGLHIYPCLPKAISEVRVTRQWRGVEYVIDIHHSGSGKNEVRIDGEILRDSLIKPGRSGRVSVQCFC
jgi:cellobiose phosphorylase